MSTLELTVCIPLPSIHGIEAHLRSPSANPHDLPQPSACAPAHNAARLLPQVHRLLRLRMTTLSFERTMRWLVPMLGAAALAIGTPAHASAASKGARAAAAAPASTAVQALPAASAVAPLLAGLDGYHFAIESRDRAGAALLRPGHAAGLRLQSRRGCALLRGGAGHRPGLRQLLVGAGLGAGPDDQCRHVGAGRGARRPRRGRGPAPCAPRHADAARADRGAGAAPSAQAASSTKPPTRSACARWRNATRATPLVALLAAEALLNLHPYDWWSADGTPRPWTPEIDGLLERAMALDPRLPGAHHYWIHLQESSPHPQRAPAQRRFPAQRGARLGPPAAHAGAHRHARRPLRGGDPGQPALDRGRPALPGAGGRAGCLPRGLRGAQPPLPVGRRVDGRPRGPGAAGRAGRLAGGLRARAAATRAAPSCSSTPCCPTSRGCASATGPRCCTTRRRPIRPRPYPLAMWHYARGTARARSGQLELAQQELAQLAAACGRAGAGRVEAQEHQPGGRSLLRIAVLTLQADLALASGKPQDGGGAAARGHAIEDALRVRRAPPVAGAHAARAGRGAAGRRAGRRRPSRSIARICATTPTMAGR